MNKRNITILAAAAIVLAIVGIVVAAATHSGSGSLLGSIFFFLAGICSIVAWIMAIIKTASIGRWGWLIVVIIFGTVGTLIYGLAGPEHRKSAAVAI